MNDDEHGTDDDGAGDGVEFVPLNRVRLTHAARAVVEHVLVDQNQTGADELVGLERAELQYVALTLARWMATAARAAGLDDHTIRQRLDQAVGDALAGDLTDPGQGDEHGPGRQ